PHSRTLLAVYLCTYVYGSLPLPDQSLTLSNSQVRSCLLEANPFYSRSPMPLCIVPLCRDASVSATDIVGARAGMRGCGRVPGTEAPGLRKVNGKEAPRNARLVNKNP